MHDIHQRDVGNHRWQKRVFDHVEIGDTDIFNHQERGRAHNGWHDLAVHRRGNLDRARLFRAEPDLLHQRNRKCTRGHHVRDGGPRDEARHGRRNNGSLRRPALHVTHQAERHLNEVIARASFIQQCAEQNEQENKRG